jgi:dTDP-4-amino-4,6-dideoxygalactose transaminase
MNVPLLDLKAQLAPLRDEILAAVTEVIDSTRYILGPKVEELEAHLAAYSDARYGIGVSSGTDALLASLMALGVGPGDLVLTTTFSFFATMGSILRLGAKPVFADIDPVTYNISPTHLEEILAGSGETTDRIKAVMPVHLYGQCADMAKIIPLAEKYGVPIVEDAAQAIGASCPLAVNGGVEWKRAGSMGAAGCFSFFPSKNLGGIGDGGMITCNDQELAEKIRIIRVHGGAPKYYHAVMGGNFRLDPIQAAVLDIKLKHLPSWHRARRSNADLYNRLFTEKGLVDSGEVVLPVSVYRDFAGAEERDFHIYNQYVIRVKERDRLLRFLGEKDIGTEIYYPVPLHRQKCLAGLGYEKITLPEADKAARETLALPIYPELQDEMQMYVVEKIAQFFQ